MARWLSFLAEYNFEVKYKPGKQKALADALSRRPDYELAHVTTVTSSIPDLIFALYASDNMCVALLKALGSKEFEDSDKELSVRKMAHLEAEPDTIDRKGTATLFLDRVFQQHGLPEAVVSDRAPFYGQVLDVHLWGACSRRVAPRGQSLDSDQAEPLAGGPAGLSDYGAQSAFAESPPHDGLSPANTASTARARPLGHRDREGGPISPEELRPSPAAGAVDIIVAAIDTLVDFRDKRSELAHALRDRSYLA
ncbi:unnamed protein product [Phytophthora fragariaefolia]|uniref:Unnamed protein product n=1 Tax=Phytophthora fragariaefolia TaxID=1490495 RepID=A0A9W7CKR1_9STRA|nr:unnamed protein product [Phytophthora fragariaefolia]